MAIVSIPSAQDFDNQLANGTPVAKIITLFDQISVLIPAASIVAWIATSQWLLQRYDERAKIQQMRRSRKWVIWGWVVPVVSLWFPKGIIDELLPKTTPSANSDLKPNPQLQGINTGLWWTTWISYNVIGALESALFILDPTGNPIRPNYQIAAACLLTASYTVWTQIIKRIG